MFHYTTAARIVYCMHVRVYIPHVSCLHIALSVLVRFETKTTLQEEFQHGGHSDTLWLLYVNSMCVICLLVCGHERVIMMMLEQISKATVLGRRGN